MANRTDPAARSVHGTNPQNLIENITRQKIYAMPYWKEKCFGVSAEKVVDLAYDLRDFGGIYGQHLRCTDFLCLILKLLQIQPEKEIIVGAAAATRAVQLLRCRVRGPDSSPACRVHKERGQ